MIPDAPRYNILMYTKSRSGSGRRVRLRALSGRALAPAGVRSRLVAHRFRVRNRWGCRASRPATRTCGAKRTRPFPGLPPRFHHPCPSAVGLPRAVAGYCNNGAPAHLLPRPELAAENDSDHCSVFPPVTARTPANPGGSGDHRKKKRRPGPFRAGFSAIPSGLRRLGAAGTGAKRSSNRRMARQHGPAASRRHAGLPDRTRAKFCSGVGQDWQCRAGARGLPEHFTRIAAGARRRGGARATS